MTAIPGLEQEEKRTGEGSRKAREPLRVRPSSGWVNTMGVAVIESKEIVTGAVYEYTAASPEGCRGKHYYAHRIVLDVPSYQRKVLVEALDGPNEGLWFTCSVMNFARRYRLAPRPESEMRADSVGTLPSLPGKNFGRIMSERA